MGYRGLKVYKIYIDHDPVFIINIFDVTICDIVHDTDALHNLCQLLTASENLF